MDKDRIEGAGKQVKGAIKDAAGKVSGDTKLQAEGNKKLRYDPNYFKHELATMKKQHEPIKLTVLGTPWFGAVLF